MKIKIYHNPNLVLIIILLVTTVVFLLNLQINSLLITIIFIIYALLSILLVLLLIQKIKNEKPFEFNMPEKLLILSPHQDDCVLMAGGLGLKNIKLGGSVRILYLTQGESDEVAKVRKQECIDAWQIAGLDSENLYQLDILPRLYESSCRKKIDSARSKLQAQIDEYKPTMVVFPLFEGGHRHHDITNYIASFLLKFPKKTLLIEAPLYSIHYSLISTPQKIFKLVARFFLLNLVAYYPSTESIDTRKILTLKMSREELLIKKQMLLAFSSQNGKALAENYGYQDRLVNWWPSKYKATAFNYDKNLAFFIAKMYEKLPYKLASAIYPTDIASHGYEYGITNLNNELIDDSMLKKSNQDGRYHF